MVGGQTPVEKILMVAAIACITSVVCARDHSVEPRYYEFYGSFEQTSVRLGGEGLPELYSACTQFVRRSGVEPIHDLAVEDRHFIRATGHFARRQVCGFVVLNAHPPGPRSIEFAETPLLTGVVGGVPFRLWGPRQEALEAARRFVPMALGGLSIGTVIVGDTQYEHSGPWSVDDVVVLIERQLRAPRPPVDYVSDGERVGRVALARA